MADWLRLGGGHSVGPPSKEQGVLFDLILSPYDLPDAARGVRLKDGRFRIEFRYIDGSETPSAARQISRHVLAFEGRHSRRLLALEVDTESLGVTAVGVTISDSESKLSKQLDLVWESVTASHESPDDKYRLLGTRQALRTRERDVFHQLVDS